MKSSEIAVAHLYDAMDKFAKSCNKLNQKQKNDFAESMFLAVYNLKSVDPSDIEVRYPDPNSYPQVSWLGFYLGTNSEAYKIALEVDHVHRHP